MRYQDNSALVFGGYVSNQLQRSFPDIVQAFPCRYPYLVRVASPFCVYLLVLCFYFQQSMSIKLGETIASKC